METNRTELTVTQKRDIDYTPRYNPLNEAIKYIAEQCAFKLNQDKLTVDTSKIPESIFLICTARNKYIKRIIQVCE